MDQFLDDRFAVFAHVDPNNRERPDHAERPLATCATYAEARRIQRELLRACRICVVRYVGPAGGGD
jgi:hypothetical protein